MRALVLLFVFAPLFAFAQTGTVTELESLLRQLSEAKARLETAKMVVPTSVASTATPITACPQFTRTLQKGSSGPEVRTLQALLVNEGYLATEPTGYFGALTEKALQDFQIKAGIVSSGSAATTGWGVFGPKTRAAITATCRGVQAWVAPVVQCSAPPVIPNEACFGSWQKIMGTNNCQSGWRCVALATSTSSSFPSILSVDGPTLIDAGTQGTWTVRPGASSGALSYSVIWGDEAAASTLMLLAGYAPQSFVSSPIFSHTYLTQGMYTPKFTVRDAAGNTTLRTLSVRVNQKVSTSSPLELFNSYTGGSCFFGGVGYPDGTETEGYTANDLCVATNGMCAQRTAYIPKFKCAQGIWTSLATNPYPSTPSYGSKVGAACPANDATLQVVVEPGSQLCRGLLCATAQNYALTSLRCAYTNWVDWGVFGSGATTTTVCAGATPCEYSFGQNGRACAAKQNGVCPATPYGNHPQN